MIENSTYLTGKAFFSTATAALLSRLKTDNLLPNLSGATVRVFGFGRTGVTGVRAPLPQDKMKKITSFWTGYFEAAKATLSLQQNLGPGNRQPRLYRSTPVPISRASSCARATIARSGAGGVSFRGGGGRRPAVPGGPTMRPGAQRPELDQTRRTPAARAEGPLLPASAADICR